MIQESKKEEARQIQSGDTVLLNLVGRRVEDSNNIQQSLQTNNGPIFQKSQSWLVTIGEPHCLVRAVEMGLEHMLEGQTALVYSTGQYNWGSAATGSRNYKAPGASSEEVVVPGDSSVIYEIEAIQIVMDTSRLNPYFNIQRSKTMKNIANDLYQYEWNIVKSRERSIRLYEKAAKAMSTLLGGTYFANVEPDHPQRSECQTIMMDSYNNLIAVYLRAKRWAKAREAAITALKADSKNTKALLRNAKAYLLDPDISMEEKDQALAKAEKVICYKDPEETELKKLRAQWKKKQRQQEQQS